jgi:hypothetical protein
MQRRIRQTGVRLPEDLCLKLEREAKRHGVSFNREVQMRLEDSLENKDAPRALDTIQQDMRGTWERYTKLEMIEAVVAKYQRQGTVLQGWLQNELRARGMDDENARQIAAIAKAYLG